MAEKLIITDDFKSGKYKLASSPDLLLKLQDYIDEHHDAFLYRLLGIDLAKLFIATIDAGTHKPVGARYLALYDPIAETDDEDLPKISKGLKDVMKALIYYHYIVDSPTDTTQSGVGRTTVDTASQSAFLNINRTAEQKFNAVLESIETIQWFCEENDDDYPEFLGLPMEVKHSMF